MSRPPTGPRRGDCGVTRFSPGSRGRPLRPAGTQLRGVRRHVGDPVGSAGPRQRPVSLLRRRTTHGVLGAAGQEGPGCAEARGAPRARCGDADGRGGGTRGPRAHGRGAVPGPGGCSPRRVVTPARPAAGRGGTRGPPELATSVPGFRRRRQHLFLSAATRCALVCGERAQTRPALG